MSLLKAFCTLSSLAFRRQSSKATLTVKQTLDSKPINEKVVVNGWVQAIREYKELFFVDLVDGTCLERLQVVVNSKNHKPPTYGSSIKVEGCIIKSPFKGQEIELIADSWQTHGTVSEDYPFQYHQKYSSEYIRQYPHLRPRTRKISSILRVRNHASMAVHKFFQESGYCFIHTPVITQNDCEGGGEVFKIESDSPPDGTLEHIETESTESDSVQTSSGDQNINTKHFFGAPTYLSVSGQLHLEAMACALSKVYNFGPIFRAEISRSRQHASEFQMIEAEIAFVQSVTELQQIVENCCKSIAESILSTCSAEVKFLSQELKKHDEYLISFLRKPFIKMTYDEAVEILQQNGNKLKSPIEYGDDLVANHKRFLVQHCDNTPVFVSMFPASTKPFYMKCENDLASCFDLFANYGGEICGGSLREDDEEILRKKFSFESKPGLEWYLDLRKFGSVPHGGFGIGFERLLQSILGVPNIRDVIAFPRRKYDCKC